MKETPDSNYYSYITVPTVISIQQCRYSAVTVAVTYPLRRTCTTIY